MDALPKDKLKKVKCIGVCGQMHGIKSGLCYHELTVYLYVLQSEGCMFPCAALACRDGVQSCGRSHFSAEYVHFSPADVQRACRVHPSKFSRPPFSCFSCLAMAASLNGANFMATFVRMLDSWMKEFDLEVNESRIYSQLIHSALGQPNI
ncbi:hypothetical protein cypCar_00023518 [Cyprinus carpio]|nr:hypothetical protein cypCar_00023518 [Cyprinus carpio]